MTQANKNYTVAEYIWIGGRGELRSKSKVVHGLKKVTVKDLPHWNYDGSSTRQAIGDDSEVLLVPRRVFADPFRRTGSHVLVVCDTYTPEMQPLFTNSRYVAEKIFSGKEAKKEKPWFGIEQEYTLFREGRPLGWPKCKARSLNNPLILLGYPAAQGPYYCGTGADKSFGRDVVEAHLEHCLYAGVTLSGVNGEVMPGQWEFQVGPCESIASGDEVIAARYILLRVAEAKGVAVSFSAKPIPGDWNGAGAHCNYSTASMRSKKGALEKHIVPAIEKLKKRHKEHVKAYGPGNADRLTGKHETAGIDKFRYGVADRGASIRIPNLTKTLRKGYFEDRRPAANMDPYIVTSMLFDTTVLNAKYSKAFDRVRIEGVDLDVLGLEVEEAERPDLDLTDEDIAALGKVEKLADVPLKGEKKPRGSPGPTRRKKKNGSWVDTISKTFNRPQKPRPSVGGSNTSERKRKKAAQECVLF